MFAMDEMAHASPFRDWSPLGKLALAIALLLASLMASSIVIPLFVFLTGFVLLFVSTRLRLPIAIVLALLQGLLIFMLSALVIALVTPGVTAWTIDLGLFMLVFSEEGLRLGLLIFLRAVAGVTVMLFFATSTPIPYLANALRQMRMPKEMVELVILIYRYAFLLLEQMEVMYTAAQCRLGFRGGKNKIRTSSKIAVGMFIRSLDVAERSQVALDCRCFRGEFPCYRPPPSISVKWIVASAAAFTMFYMANSLLADPFSIAALLSL